jgi:hypothetical protein
MHLENDNHRFMNIMKTERDLQGEGGGGTLGNLSTSTTSVDIDRLDQFKGSNDFILVEENNRSSTTQAIKSWAKRKVNSACTRKMLHRRVPILNWLPKYDSSCAVGDLVAGITVGLTVIPQALAYSNIAGLPAQYGLYSSFLGCFVYIIFGSCKDVPMGPTAIAALLTYQAVNSKGPAHAILLCFLTGILQVLMGFFGLGKSKHLRSRKVLQVSFQRIFDRFRVWTGFVRIHFCSSFDYNHFPNKRRAGDYCVRSDIRGHLEKSLQGHS